MRGKYIAFAGIDGSGKSTQAELLAGWLLERGRHAILREGKRDFVSQVSGLIAARHGITDRSAYLGEDQYLLCLAYDVLREISLDIMPFVEAGAYVVSSRSPYCRLAGAQRRGAASIAQAKEIMLFSGEPDLVIWLDLPADIAAERVSCRSLCASPAEQLECYRTAFETILPGNLLRIECGREMSGLDVHDLVVAALSDSGILSQ